jgi:mono/diheme cytochrome c family protein
MIVIGIIACLLPFGAAAQNMSRGAYLAKLGDCVTCHTAPGGRKYAGGYPVNSPLGFIYGSNITPDPAYGIGNYTLEDFTRAVREGIAKDGRRLYPAMPYPFFAGMTDADIKALYDYFMHEVEPVAHRPPETALPFPFNQRWGMIVWNWAFLKEERYRPRKEHTESWNRGAYLVRTVGHCGACHTPIGVAFQDKGDNEDDPDFLTGDTLDHWFAASLRADEAGGLGRWSQDDIVSFLTTGRGAGGMVFGSMKPVVENYTHLRAEDARAIAEYLKSLSAAGEPSSYKPEEAARSDPFERPGAGLYASFCASCHGMRGEGGMPKAPKLAGNAAVLSRDPTSVIHIVLEGGGSPARKGRGGMPAFGQRFDDRQIAEIVTFIRNRWGNHASPATGRQVHRLRQALAGEEREAKPPGP